MALTQQQIDALVADDPYTVTLTNGRTTTGLFQATTTVRVNTAGRRQRPTWEDVDGLAFTFTTGATKKFAVSDVDTAVSAA